MCACCHRFVGTPATQLAMLEGLSRADTTTASTSTTKSKKRRRSSDSPMANTAPSRRSAVASAPPSHLPDLPTFQTTPKGQEEGEEQGRGDIWRCTGGAPCDDVYCSSGCQEAALAAGHGLICIGGSGEGRRVVDSVTKSTRVAPAPPRRVEPPCPSPLPPSQLLQCFGLSSSESQFDLTEPNPPMTFV